MAQRAIGSRKGTALVEVAMVLPVLLVILFGIVEFGFILYNKAVITNSSREGARAGIVYRVNVANGIYEPYTTDDIQGVVNTYLNGGSLLIPPSTPAVATPDGICTEFPENPRPFLSVRVEYTYPYFVLPNLVASITGPVVIRGESVMRCE